MITEESNKLIAEFMDYPDLGTEGDFSYLKYHKSWDWLMPVAEKCVCQITDADEEDHLFAQIHDALWAFNIEETHNAVVEFIKWYNEE